MAVQFSHPTMLVTLGNDGDDVVLSEAQFVIVPPLKVDYGPADGERRKLAKLAKAVNNAAFGTNHRRILT